MSTISPERSPGCSREAGFTIPTAIFIIVILSALGAFMVTIGSGQQTGLAQDVSSVRVLQAARAGSEWGVYQVLNTSGGFKTGCDAGIASPVTLPSLQGMNGIAVKVECSSAAYTEGATALHSYAITATACNSSVCPDTSATLPPQYVERRLSANVAN